MNYSNLVSALVLFMTANVAMAAALPTECGSGTYQRLVNVRTAAELTTALLKPQAGDLIYLANGSYQGNFKITSSGTAAAPIVLCGGRNAVLDGKSLKSGYTLHLQGSYWRFIGFSVTQGKNAIILDNSSYNILEKLIIYRTGNEALHLRTNSSYNIIKNCEVSHAGLYTESYGEGIYIGSAKSNWCTYTDCNPDRSDNNQVLYNKVFATAAEPLDLKEGTTNTLIQGNTFDATDITGANAADSWIDVKGNNVVIRDNVGLNSGAVMLDGYQTHVVVEGWGENIVFANNISTVNAKGYAINVHNKSKEVTVYCDNEVHGANMGLSNIPCTPIEGSTPVVTNPAPEPSVPQTPTTPTKSKSSKLKSALKKLKSK